ncbi:MAG: HAD family hydrolase [Solirubrobacterales bacterium]
MSAGEGVAAVVFDLDGVIVVSEALWTRERRELAEQSGGRWLDEAQEAMQGLSSPEWTRYMRDELKVPLDPREISDAVVAKMDRAYREHLPLVPGAVAAVRALDERWPLALASSANRELIDLVLELSGLAESFDATVSSEEVANGKPSPDVFLEAARRLGTPPERCVAIEDSGNGILAAHAAGMKVIAVPNPELPPAPHTLDLAEAEIATIAELSPALVERLG